MTRAGALVAALSVAALAGCGDSDGGTGLGLVASLRDVAKRDTSPVRTDSASYRLERVDQWYTVSIVATYRNDGPGPVYFPRCGPTSTTPMAWIGRADPNSAAPFAWGIVFGCVGGAPTGTLGVGESVTLRVPLSTLIEQRPESFPRRQPEDLVGQARITFDLCANYSADSDRCIRLPASKSQSNAFLLHY